MSNNDNVVVLPVITSLDTTPERVLEGALKKELESAIVIGRHKDGSLFFSASEADGCSVLWDIEIAKLALLAVETSS